MKKKNKEKEEEEEYLKSFKQKVFYLLFRDE